MQTLVHPVAPFPGLPEHLEFELSSLDDEGTLFALRSATNPDVRLFVIRPEVFWAEYTPDLGPLLLEAVGLADGQDPMLLVVVHPGSEHVPATANLLAPILINPATGAASQVILNDSDWPLQARLG
ncbi:MAG: flagellar assembly protein FliW [Cellulomonas sp.]|nr:flagellar assembly protein FliW [Cellulomonas sp.]